ncbi:hypothetical protein BD770DRAFT_412332 [Pilaira anomala]|nr:hypothetical protein BD770DRAFT_412332 [Pilaira anomala]
MKLLTVWLTLLPRWMNQGCRTAVKLWDEHMKRIEIKATSLRSNDKDNSKKQKSDEVDASTLSEIDNVLFSDNNLSVGTIIKRKAVELFNDGTACNSRDYKIMTNGLSSILDICDITESSQKSLFKNGEWEFLVKMYTKKYDITLIPVYDLILSTWKIVTYTIKNTRDISFGLKYLYQIFPKHLKTQHFFCLKLCEHMLNLIQMHPTMLIKVDPPAFSENDYLRVVWSNFFEYLFPASGNIKIKTHNNRDIDICAGEIASHDGDNKTIDDEGKLNRESKDIMDNLISIIPRNKSNFIARKKKQDLNPTYKDCVFDENGWTFSGDHWFNTITNDRSTSSPYEASDDEEGVASFYKHH